MSLDKISSGARTVETVAHHFVELKQQALELLGSFGASRRGYFTPTEDEAVRHLLVSYWQSRNALIELVASIHNDARLPRQLRPAGFLVAYAGALVLIDAARFLRKHIHVRPVVRRKLNEPEPHFGIPEGTYDRIQKSLTSPVHVWHVYFATCYFDEHRDRLINLANRLGLVPMVEQIERLQPQVRVAVGVYTRTRVRVRAQEVRTGISRDLLAKALYGLQKSVSRLISDRYTHRGHQPAVPAPIVQQFSTLLQPGDVLITRKEHALTNYFLPGYWPHAALYLGDAEQLKSLRVDMDVNVSGRWQRLMQCDLEEPRRVLEALKDGVWIRSFTSPMASDAVAVLRPLLGQADIAKSIARGMFHDGKPYDFDFDFTRTDRMVCTEVIYRSYEGVAGVSFSLTRRAGRLTLSAEDLLQMALNRRHFEPLAVYAPTYSAELLIGPAAESALRRSTGCTET